METQKSSNYFKILYKDPSRNLNNVIRYSGVYCTRPESDGAHVIDMMALSLKISSIIREKTGIVLDKKDLIYRCYVHDLEEACSVDLPRGIKYYNQKILESFNEVVSELLKLNYSEEMISDIHTSKDINSPEGIVVRVSDTIQASMKIYEEHKLGNYHFDKLMIEHSDYLSDLVDKIRKSLLFKSDEYKEMMNVLVDIVYDFKRTIDKEINKLR